MKPKKQVKKKFENKTAFLTPSKVKISEDGSRILIFLGPLNIISLHRNFLNVLLNNPGGSK
jgi:hypothetical protein